MGVRTGVEIQSNGMNRRVINIAEGLKAVGNDGQHAVVLIVGEAIEKLVIVIDLPVDASEAFHLAEGRAITADDRGKWSARQHWIE